MVNESEEADGKEDSSGTPDEIDFFKAEPDPVEDAEKADNADDAEKADDAEEADKESAEEKDFSLGLSGVDAEFIGKIPEICANRGAGLSVEIAPASDEGDGQSWSVNFKCADQETLDALSADEAVKKQLELLSESGAVQDATPNGFAPNTVGAVIGLLKKFDPNSRLFIRMNPEKYECMIFDISGKLMLKGQNVTYMEIAKGGPDAALQEEQPPEK